MANYLKNIIILVIACQFCKGQNLVPNPGFDSTIVPCPTNNGYHPLGSLISGWNDIGTADWYSTCRVINSYSLHVPNNCIGYEPAHSDSSYIGICTFWSSAQNYREYIECQLLNTLESQQEYCVSFYQSLADSISFASNLDVLLLPNHIPWSPDGNLINSNPQLSFTSNLENKTGWTKLTGTFIANGSERYLVLGNFKDDQHINTTFVGSNASNMCGGQSPLLAYYFIDDVSVTPINYFHSNAGKDTTICLNEQVQIGDSLHNGCIYRWSPAIGLSDTTLAQPIASPSQTTTYILTLTDTNVTTECADWHTTTDSVTITVIPLADAGSDQQICEGYNMQIGTSEVTGVTYEWNPQVYLSNYSAAQPFASPPQTMSYVLTVSDSLLSSHCRTSDTVMVGVIPCVNEISVYPNPNNGSFILEYNLSSANSAAFYIYNVLGQKVYSSLLPTTSSKGERVEINTLFSPGVYFWQVESGEKKIAIGKIVIID